MIKVAIDTGPLADGNAIRGIGTYTDELVESIRKLKTKDLEVEAADFSKLILNKYDILHFTNFSPYTGKFPAAKNNKWVVSVHDLIPLIYPEIYSPGVRGKYNFYKNKKSLKKAEKVIAVSETTKKDIVRLLGIKEDKIKVIYEAANNSFRQLSASEKSLGISNKYNLPNKFILYVGDVNYNKNLGILLEAVLKTGIPLVLCGKQAVEIKNKSWVTQKEGPRDVFRKILGKDHPETAHFSDLSEKLDSPNIHVLGYVSEPELVQIYNMATLYVQPSLYEGFGLPVIEAMSCGTPVIVSKTQALVEIAGDSAIVVDTKNKGDFAEKIKNVFLDSSLKLKLSRIGLQRSKEFSWEKAARETIEAYMEAAEETL